MQGAEKKLYFVRIKLCTVVVVNAISFFFFFSFSGKVWPVGVGKLCTYLFLVFISSDHCLNASRLSKPYKASLPLQLCAFTSI